MNYEIRHSPSFSLLELQLEQSEQIVAEAGAMVYMRGDIDIKTRTRSGGLFGKLKVSLIGGESLFLNEYTANGPSKIGMAAAPLGDIIKLDISPGLGYIVQTGGYIASTLGVELNTQWQGFKGVFGHGIFMLKSSGQGEMYINSFGAMDKHTLGAGESMTVDNFHLIAFSDSCTYNVKKFGGLKSTLLGGEGLVTDVSGPGDIYIQTKNAGEFGRWMAKFIPRAETRTSGSGIRFG